MSLLSEVAFGAFLQYSPRGTSEVSILSRRWRDAIKGDQPGQLRRVAELLAGRTEPDVAQLRDRLFGTDVVLVPVPRSAPLRPGALWPGRRICEELVGQRLAGEIAELVERASPVQKSAYAARGERPSPQAHLESLRVAGDLVTSGRLLLVDDFVTKGSTLLAAATALTAARPRAEVACFALVRTRGLQPDVDRVVAPCVGTITHHGNEAFRTP